MNVITRSLLTITSKDVQLVQRIDDKMGLIELCMTMQYKGGVNLSDTFGTTAIWDSIICRELAQSNIIIPPSNQNIKTALSRWLC